ncbi:MAG: glycosyltransferase family 2 protein [Gemmatimonadaceae bacterium]
MREVQFGVVVINWNGANDTLAALDSLLLATPRPDHVIVVDNGSTDDSLDRIRDWGASHAPGWGETVPPALDSCDANSWLVLVAADSNLGFSGANNVGLHYLAARTAASHFMLLNNDAMVAPDCFAQLASAICDVPDAGLLSPVIFRHPNRDEVWYAGGIEIPHRALIVHARTPANSDRPYPTTFVTGCAMTIARPMYDDLGGLAEVYNPIYWEDADYSRRACDAGWSVAVAPRAHVYHRVGRSGAGERLTPRTAYFQNRNRALYVRRNYHGTDRILGLAYLVVTKPGRALMEALRGQRALGGAIFRGFLRGMTQRAW